MTKEEKTAKNSHKAGHIYQVLGAVVDVKFESEADLPDIYTALECDNHGKRLVLEVEQHLGECVVRCIAPAPPNKPILPPLLYGSSKSITLIPVTKISSLVD